MGLDGVEDSSVSAMPMQGRPLGKWWKLLASVNIFIVSLKSKWRRRRKADGVMVDNWTRPNIKKEYDEEKGKLRLPLETRRRRSSESQRTHLGKGQEIRREQSIEGTQAVLRVEEMKDGYHYPASFTRQLAFGPWENAASQGRFRNYLVKVPFAKIVTLVIFLISIIVVTVICVKEAEVEEKLRKQYGWSN